MTSHFYFIGWGRGVAQERDTNKCNTLYDNLLQQKSYLVCNLCYIITVSIFDYLKNNNQFPRYRFTLSQTNSFGLVVGWALNASYVQTHSFL